LKKDFGLTAHSLRHTFRDRLRATGCPLELIDQIGGWSSIGTIGSKYGQGYDLDAVREQLNKILLASARSQKATPMHLLERWDEVHRGADRDCKD
jgi:integrase